MKKYLRIAATQYPVSNDMCKNYGYIKRLIRKASKNNVEVIHFPETALPGYLSFPKGDPSAFDWSTLDAFTKEICNLAVSNKMWIVLGSVRKVKGQLPRSCICVISNTGKLVGYYDKQRIYKAEKEHYSPGKSPLVIKIKGYKCGFLICYDNCYPELYTTYRNLGAGLIFQSIYNAGSKKGPTNIKDLFAANLLVRSADNQMWISASNSSKAYCPCPATVARPDGSANKAKRHITALVIEDYPKAELGWTYDNTKF